MILGVGVGGGFIRQSELKGAQTDLHTGTEDTKDKTGRVGTDPRDVFPPSLPTQGRHH